MNIELDVVAILRSRTTDIIQHLTDLIVDNPEFQNYTQELAEARYHQLAGKPVEFDEQGENLLYWDIYASIQASVVTQVVHNLNRTEGFFPTK
jgi:hypothetical protein